MKSLRVFASHSDGEEKEMNSRTEGQIAIVTALLVLFSAMLSPCLSVVVAIAGLAALGVYRFVQKTGN